MEQRSMIQLSLAEQKLLSDLCKTEGGNEVRQGGGRSNKPEARGKEQEARRKTDVGYWIRLSDKNKSCQILASQDPG